MPPKRGVSSGLGGPRRRERGEGDSNDFLVEIVRHNQAVAHAETQAKEKAKADEAARQAEIDKIKADAAAERKRLQDNANSLEDAVSGTGADIAIGSAASDAVLATGQKNKRKRGGGKEQGRVVGGVDNSTVGGL